MVHQGVTAGTAHGEGVSGYHVSFWGGRIGDQSVESQAVLHSRAQQWSKCGRGWGKYRAGSADAVSCAGAAVLVEYPLETEYVSCYSTPGIVDTLCLGTISYK